jgi:hypothetical protein
VSGWDDPTGWPWYAVGLCDRCHRRFPLHELLEDGNLPGLRVCRDDWDELDPYRLPARQTENITLPFVRPDVPIAVQPVVLATFYILTEGSDPIITEDDDNLITETA